MEKHEDACPSLSGNDAAAATAADAADANAAAACLQCRATYKSVGDADADAGHSEGLAWKYGCWTSVQAKYVNQGYRILL